MNVSQQDIMHIITAEWQMAQNVDHNAWHSVMDVISTLEMVAVKGKATIGFKEQLRTLWSVALELYVKS